MAIITAGFHIENTFELHNDGSKTKEEYISFIRPTLIEWFSTLNPEAMEVTISNVTNAILEHTANEFRSPPATVDYSKWDLIVERVAAGKCGVCGKVLPLTFATVEAFVKHSNEVVNLTFCVPCMDT